MSAPRYAHYADLAELFDFPGADYPARVEWVQAVLGERHPKAVAELGLFAAAMPASENARQELYTRTFEIQSLTTLSVGYILFGDDYKRGDLLANLNREHGLVGNDCRGELADHLPNLLRLVPLIEDEELRTEMMADLLLPAVALMAREFDPERVSKKDANYEKHYKTLIVAPVPDKTVFRHAFQALLQVMRKDFEGPGAHDSLEDIAARHRSSDFLGMIERELEVEATANAANNSGRDH